MCDSSVVILRCGAGCFEPSAGCLLQVTSKRASSVVTRLASEVELGLVEGNVEFVEGDLDFIEV